MAEGAALEGGPAAVGERWVGFDRARFGQPLDQRQVGPVAFAQLAALLDGKALRDGMAGFLHQGGKRQQAVGD
jgi:hypothetical protein